MQSAQQGSISEPAPTTSHSHSISANDLLEILCSSTPVNKVFTCLPQGVFTPAAVEYLVETIGIMSIDTEVKLRLLERQLNGLTVYDSPGGGKKDWTVFSFAIKRLSDEICRLTYHDQDQRPVSVEFQALSLD